MNSETAYFPTYFRLLLLSSFLIIAISGCMRGRPSEKPPIHLNPNMDKQERYRTQSESLFFDNASAMRVPVAGTVSRGNLKEDTIYYEGKTAEGSYVHPMPVKVDMKLLKRGQERFGIYCAVCHGETGEGNGIVTKRGLLPPPSFHDDRLRKVEDGYLFNVITNGKGNMQTYRHQVNVPDRWAIVAYIRGLQRSQNASINDIPDAQRTNLQ